jgi:hypothetical protein
MLSSSVTFFQFYPEGTYPRQLLPYQCQKEAQEAFPNGQVVPSDNQNPVTRLVVTRIQRNKLHSSPNFF